MLMEVVLSIFLENWSCVHMLYTGWPPKVSHCFRIIGKSF